MKIVVCKVKHLYLSFKIKGTCDYWMLRKCLFAVQTLICLALRRWYMTSMILFVSEQGARTDLPYCMGNWLTLLYGELTYPAVWGTDLLCCMGNWLTLLYGELTYSAVWGTDLLCCMGNWLTLLYGGLDGAGGATTGERGAARPTARGRGKVPL